MRGSIRSFLPDKGYGFIRGDDGRDYFFHASAFAGVDGGAGIIDAALVEFDERATPKGYRAVCCRLVGPSASDAYDTPPEFLTSKTSQVRGWEVMDRAAWVVHGGSRNSPDAARREAEAAARWLGANALLELEYYKSTGSEAGTGRGTHHFTVHHFRGRPVVLAKRHAAGSKRAADLTGLDGRAAALKARLEQKTQDSLTKAIVAWVVAAIVALVAVATHIGLLVVSALLVIVFGRPTNHDRWLEPS